MARFAAARHALAIEATMLRLKRTQRELITDKLPDTANLALGALVFGQFLAASFSIALLVLGMGH